MEYFFDARSKPQIRTMQAFGVMSHLKAVSQYSLSLAG
jgi:hypothetical protein